MAFSQHPMLPPATNVAGRDPAHSAPALSPVITANDRCPAAAPAGERHM